LTLLLRQPEDAVVGGDVLQLGRDLRVGRPARPIIVELARGDLTWWG